MPECTVLQTVTVIDIYACRSYVNMDVDKSNVSNGFFILILAVSFYQFADNLCEPFGLLMFPSRCVCVCLWLCVCLYSQLKFARIKHTQPAMRISIVCRSPIDCYR